MTLAERTLRTQRANLKNVDNYKFTHNDYEYRLSYNGGVAEFISIYGRRRGTEEYRYINGFEGYPLFTKDQVIETAKKFISET